MLTYSKSEEMKAKYVEILAEKHAQAMLNRQKQHEEKQIENRKKLTQEVAKTNKDQATQKPYLQTLTPQKVIPPAIHVRSKSTMQDDTPTSGFADLFHH